jgi:hypothetical protein
VHRSSQDWGGLDVDAFQKSNDFRTLVRIGEDVAEGEDTRRAVIGTVTARQSLYSSQQNLISARLLDATNLVNLYSVLGGGSQEKRLP